MEELLALAKAVELARSANEARLLLDNYALEHKLTRVEALAQLTSLAKRRGGSPVQQFAEDYRAHQAWTREHPVAAVTLNSLDPSGLGSSTLRSARRWLNTKPAKGIVEDVQVPSVEAGGQAKGNR